VIRGLYSSANGLLVQSARTDVISSNLAGLSVPGFRRDVPVVTAFPRALQYAARGRAAAGAPGSSSIVLAPETSVDLQPGALRSTGAPFDLALDGPGYFSVQTPAGEAYTRSGAFRLDAAGRQAGLAALVTQSGHPVLGQTGPIRISGAEFEVLDNGDILVDGARVDRLKLADFPTGTQMQKLGDGLLRPLRPVAPLPAAGISATVRQGYLEEANVNAVSELAAMISALRSFEASQRALHAADQTLDKVINEIGRT